MYISQFRFFTKRAAVFPSALISRMTAPCGSKFSSALQNNGHQYLPTGDGIKEGAEGKSPFRWAPATASTTSAIPGSGIRLIRSISTTTGYTPMTREYPILSTQAPQQTGVVVRCRGPIVHRRQLLSQPHLARLTTGTRFQSPTTRMESSQVQAA